MTGAGILALAHAGFHNSAEAQSAGQWMLEHSFDQYNGNDNSPVDRYHYSLFNACQGMYQLGSPYWEKFFPARRGHDARPPERRRVVGRRRAWRAIDRSATRTRRLCRSWRSVRRTSFCRSFNVEPNA